MIQNRCQQHYPDFLFLAIEEIGSGTDVRDSIVEADMSFSVPAGNDAINRKYNIHSYPTSFFFDEDGMIQSVLLAASPAQL